MMRAMVGYAWIKCRPHHKSMGHANPPYESVVAANRLREARGDCERMAETLGLHERGDTQEKPASTDDLKALRSAAEEATEASVAAGLEDSSRSLAALTAAARRSGEAP